MKNRLQLIAFASVLFILTVSCGKDSPLESGDFAEATLSLSVEFPQTKTGIPVSAIEHDRITVYYGDVTQTSFQQGRIIGDSLIFNYPILLKVGNPGRLRATYVNDAYSPIVPGAKTLVDSLYVDSEDPSTINISYDEDKYSITLNFKHCNALADFTLLNEKAENITRQIEKIFVLTSQNDSTEQIYAEASPKVIVPGGCLLKHIIIFLQGGKEIKVKNNSNIVFERNKRYPIHISLNPKELNINPEEGIDDWR